MKHGSVLVIDADGKGLLVHHHLKLPALNHGLVLSIRQFGLCGQDPFPIILHQVIHGILPCSHDQTIGPFCKITVKPRPDPYDGIRHKPDTDFHTVGLNGIVTVPGTDSHCLFTYLHTAPP